jgi:hypothetical protein
MDSPFKAVWRHNSKQIKTESEASACRSLVVQSTGQMGWLARSSLGQKSRIQQETRNDFMRVSFGWQNTAVNAVPIALFFNRRSLLA